jgi:hypothetical protein
MSSYTLHWPISHLPTPTSHGLPWGTIHIHRSCLPRHIPTSPPGAKSSDVTSPATYLTHHRSVACNSGGSSHPSHHRGRCPRNLHLWPMVYGRWIEEVDKIVNALFGWSANTGVLQREWPVTHVLACPHGLSLIDLECNLKFLENRSIRFPKPNGLVLRDSAFTGCACRLWR